MALGAAVHAYATISFDYIIVFRPGGIIHVNKLHIFFHSASPSPAFFCATGRAAPSSYSRDFVIAANSRRLFDPPLSRFLFARRVREMPGGSFRDNPFTERAKVCKVFRWGVGTNEQRAEILNTAGKMGDKCADPLMVHSQCFI